MKKIILTFFIITSKLLFSQEKIPNTNFPEPKAPIIELLNNYSGENLGFLKGDIKTLIVSSLISDPEDYHEIKQEVKHELNREKGRVCTIKTETHYRNDYEKSIFLDTIFPSNSLVVKRIDNNTIKSYKKEYKEYPRIFYFKDNQIIKETFNNSLTEAIYNTNKQIIVLTEKAYSPDYKEYTKTKKEFLYNNEGKLIGIKKQINSFNSDSFDKDTDLNNQHWNAKTNSIENIRVENYSYNKEGKLTYVNTVENSDNEYRQEYIINYSKNLITIQLNNAVGTENEEIIEKRNIQLDAFENPVRMEVLVQEIDDLFIESKGESCTITYTYY